MSSYADFATVAKDLKAKIATRKAAPAGTYQNAAKTVQCNPGCEICGGIGYVRWDRLVSDPLFGLSEPCPNLPREHRHIMLRTGLFMDEQDGLDWHKIKATPLDTLTVHLGDTPLDVKPKTAARVAEGIRKYIADQGWGLVYIFGPYGNAKTLILKTAVARATDGGLDAAYVTMLDLLDNVREAYDTKDPRDSALNRMRRFLDIPFLALDEFEKYPGTAWERERVFQLIDRRNMGGYSMRAQLTLIAANKRPEEVDPAIASRVHDGRNLYVEMIGKDARPGMTADDRF